MERVNGTHANVRIGEEGLSIDGLIFFSFDFDPWGDDNFAIGICLPH